MSRTLTIDTDSEPGSYARFLAQRDGHRFIPEQPSSEHEGGNAPDGGAEQVGIGSVHNGDNR